MADRKTIGLRDVRSLQPGEIIWDAKVPAFGARRQRSAAVSYILFYRTKDGRQRWQTIGRHGAPWTPDTAREEARRLLGEVVKGDDPAAAKREARKAATVLELCERYHSAAAAGRILTRRKAAKKPSTLATDKGRIERHIKPLLGNLKVSAVTRADIERFRDAVTEGETAARIKTGKHGLARVTGGRGTATRTIGLLGAIFGFGVRCGLRPDNPVRGVERHADGQRSRRLSETEYAALGQVLRTMPETTWPIALAATTFLARTGWRRGETLALNWPEVDLATGTALHTLTGHQAPIQAVAVTSDDSWALTGSDDWTVAVWSLDTGARAAIWHGDASMLHAASAPGTHTFAVGDFRGGVYILRLQI